MKGMYSDNSAFFYCTFSYFLSRNRGQFGASCDFSMTSGCSRDPEPERQERYNETHEQSTTHAPAETNTPDTPRGCRMTRGHPAVDFAENLLGSQDW